MKKSLIVLFLFVFAFSAFADDFITTYDDIMDVTFITHKDMKIGALYNLRDDLAGERENLRLYISNGVLVLNSSYQFSRWLDMQQVVIVSDNGRFVVDKGDNDKNIVTGKIVRESFITVLTETQASELLNVLNGANPIACFVGSRGRTDKLKIKSKTLSALIATIEYYSAQN